MLPISKSERDAVIAELLLGGEGDTPEEAARDLAGRVIHAFLDAREGRETWCLISWTEERPTAAVGPYATVAAVRKAALRREVHMDESVRALRLRSPAAAKEHVASVTSPPDRARQAVENHYQWLVRKGRSRQAAAAFVRSVYRLTPEEGERYGLPGEEEG